MCLILKLPAGDTLTDAEILDIYTRNRDGFGAVWHDAAGEVRTLRTLPRHEQQAISDFRLARETSQGCELWLHWRMATHGVVSLDMAHPFRLPCGVALLHNGVFGDLGDHERSDTAELCQDTLAPYIDKYGPDVLASDVFKSWADKRVDGSAVVIFAPSGAVHRFGNNGIIVGDRWYSNTYAWSAPGQSRASYGRLVGGTWRWFDVGANDDSIAYEADQARRWRKALADPTDDADTDEFAEYVDARLYTPGVICSGGRSALLLTLARLVAGYDRELSRDLTDDLLTEDRWGAYADHLVERAIETLQAATDLELILTETGELWAVEVESEDAYGDWTDHPYRR